MRTQPRATGKLIEGRGFGRTVRRASVADDAHPQQFFFVAGLDVALALEFEPAVVEHRKLLSEARS